MKEGVVNCYVLPPLVKRKNIQKKVCPSLNRTEMQGGVGGMSEADAAFRSNFSRPVADWTADCFLYIFSQEVGTPHQTSMGLLQNISAANVIGR